MNSKLVVTVKISIGANTDRAIQMMRARSFLTKEIESIRFTRMVTMHAYDKPKEELFYSNMLATFNTGLDEQSLVTLLKNAEIELGDSTELRKRGIVMMDLDLLQYDKEKHHIDDWQRAYVKQLMEELE